MLFSKTHTHTHRNGRFLSHTHTHTKHLAQTYPLVGTIRTVGFAIAAPLAGDAIVLRTGELFQRIARRGWTVVLVRLIATVVIVVAHPALLDAAPVATGELIRSAGFI